MFHAFLMALRAQGVPVGTTEWLTFHRALTTGAIVDIDGLHDVGRAILARSEADFAGYDAAFAMAFSGAVVDPERRAQLEAWLAVAAAKREGAFVEHAHADLDALWRAFLETLKAQKEAHHGGNRWVGTGGTSPFGHSGRGAQGIRVGGPGGGRQAAVVADPRTWEPYRIDRRMEERDVRVALRALRRLAHDGEPEVDLDASVEATAQNGGDVDVVLRPMRRNEVRLVLFLDVGGSMEPYARRVEALLAAAVAERSFRSLDTYTFHNCIYGHVYEGLDSVRRVKTETVLDGLTGRHRVLMVGDASMAPWELFSSGGWPGQSEMTGLDWLRRVRARAPRSLWLNPEPKMTWGHPTVEAIGRVFPMVELTIAGLREGVGRLRKAA